MQSRLSLSSFWLRIFLFVVLFFSIWILYSRVFVQQKLLESNTEPHKIRVEVYYEVLCPDSRYFVLHHLHPTWEKIGDILDVNLKPYGKASYQKTAGGFTFQCQHGNVECIGNMIHACAIKYVRKSSLIMDYVKCMISDNHEPQLIGSKCAKSLDINWAEIEKCSTNYEGQELLSMYGDDTDSLRPRISFVPTILLDGSQDGQKDILKNFMLKVCKLYSGPKPKECKEIL